MNKEIISMPPYGVNKFKAPFPYFGGKSKVAAIIWSRLGDVPNFIEPMMGSGAVLLARPHAPSIETVNDLSGFVSNFYRAIKHDPDAVAEHASWPSLENDLHARHYWLIQQKGSLQARLEGNPDYYDAKIAGWWVWGMALWIGGGFCDGIGPWQSVDGELVKVDNSIPGVKRQLIHMGNAGQGVNRQRIHLLRQDQGIMADSAQWGIHQWFNALSQRLARTRVACGDWKRVCGPTITYGNGLTGIFMDPPYGHAATREKLYEQDSLEVADECRAWCIQNGDNPLLRIALCGYQGEHEELLQHGWTFYAWETSGGYGSQGQGRGRDNAKREIIWFSPHCLKDDQLKLF